MFDSLERDIMTLERTDGNLRFLINAYIDGRVDYSFAKVAIANEVIFLERIIEIRLGRDYVLLTTLGDVKFSPFKDKDKVEDIIDTCTAVIAVSKIVVEELKEVRDR